MRVLDLASLEIRRLRTPLRRAALAFLVAVPVLCGGGYLWANWDPYGRLDQVPVAVVNDDRPVTANGRTVDAGGLFVEQLRTTPLFDWRFVDGEEARRGQRDGRYYLVISVPADFSARLVSGETLTPRRAAMDIRLDDANGYVAGTMARTVRSELEHQVAAAAVTAYAEATVGNLKTVSDGLGEAAFATGRLARGASSAQTGAAQLERGVNRIRSGAGRLVPGSRRVAEGVHRINTAVSPVLAQVDDGLPTLATSAGDVSTLTGQVTAGTDSMRRAAQQANGRVDELARAHPDIDFSALRRAQRQVLTAASTASGLASRASARASSVSRGVSALRNQLGTAASDLRELDSGAGQVADGVAALDAELGQAQRRSAQLAGDVGRVSSGAAQLASGLDRARERVPSMDAGERSAAAHLLARAVDVTVHNPHPAGVHGRGLAPFLFGIALWVFGIVAFLVLRPVSTRLLAGRTGPLSTTLAAWLPAVGAGLVGGSALFLVTEVGLGLRPVNLLGTVGLLALAVAAFTAVVHLLRLAFGVAGTAIASVLLMVQLIACGGLYPPETLPLPFQVIHPVLPMTHLVDGLRVTVSGGVPDHLLLATAVLAGYLVVALASMVVLTALRRTWTVRRLRPHRL